MAKYSHSREAIVPETDSVLLESLRAKSASERARVGGAPLRLPASEGEVRGAESRIGFRLPPLLRRVYAEVSDGGLGPGYGLLSLKGEDSLLSKYAEFRTQGWPETLLPCWDWGDAIWSCVDTSDPENRIVTHDDVAGPTLTDFTLRSWLRAWADGVDLWKELYDDKDATIVNPFTRRPAPTKVRGVAKGRPWSPPGHASGQ
jgi:hypothetical protein